MSDEKTGSNEILNVVVDLSHHNQTVDFKATKQDKILGIIHKATQGITYTDPTYQDRKNQAIEATLMWGAYHFGVGGDGIAQAKHFLKFVNPGPGDLLVLDLEENPQGTSMTLQEAEDFAAYIHDVTGCWPGLYSGNYIKEKLGNPANTILSNCWFWLAQYGSNPVVPKAWKNWTMWQYTDGIYGPEPHAVNGIGNCDRDKFNGSFIDLKTLWHLK
jgi:lysozyme